MRILQLYEIVPAVVAVTVAIAGLKLIRFLRNKVPSAKKSTGTIFGISVIVVSGCFLLVYSCAMTVKFRSTPIVSPDGRHIARITELDGGAMDSFHTTVEVRSHWHVYPDEVFRIPENHPRDVQAKWVNDSELVIRYVSRRSQRVR